jgi:DNA-directed RNA polymerase subunit K
VYIFEIEILHKLLYILASQSMNNILTRFEKVRILGQRATQISQGAIPLVDITGLTDALSIAEKEFAEGKIPMKVKRVMPSGQVVEISLSDMVYIF